MSCKRASGSVISRQPALISVRICCFFAADGVISAKPPLPAGLGKILPSISYMALRSP
jgi:hypothetical protein